MNIYSEDMKSEDASADLRRFTQQAAGLGDRPHPPGERFHEDFALLVCSPRDGWAIGLRVDFTSEAWSIAEVVALPVGPVQTLPTVNTEDMLSYIASAVERARGRQRALADQLAKLATNADFIQERFETWADKNAARTNVEYAALAVKYAEQIRLGNSRATATIAEMVGMSPSVMAQRIKEARRRYLLTSGERGRASGALSPLGALYADPQFPGMRNLHHGGMSTREIADKYGISEKMVWSGVEAEGVRPGASLIDELFEPDYAAER